MCRFRASHDDMICDQTVEKAPLRELQDSLHLEPELDLSSALMIASRVRHAMHKSKLLNSALTGALAVPKVLRRLYKTLQGLVKSAGLWFC